MPSTYTTNLGIEKIATGEQSGTWGTTTNTNLDIIDEAVNGILTVTLSSAGSSGSPTALPITDGSSSTGRNKFIEFNDGGDLGGTAFVQLTPNDAEKIVHMRNSLSGSRAVIVFQGTYNSSNDFQIENGKDVLLKFSGTGSGATVTDVFADLAATKLSVTGNITGSDITASGTLNVTGDTSSGDDAAIGFTSAEGLILTGQGSTNDVTVKNDADADVLVIPTGTTNVDIVGDATAATFKPDGDTSAGDTAAIGFTSSEGLILTGQGSSTDVTIKNDADATVASIATGTTVLTINDDVTVVGRAVGSTITAEDNAVYDLALGNNFTTTTAGTVTLTFSNKAAGQTGCIKFVNGGGHTVNAHDDVAISATGLAALAVTGTYLVTYYVTAASGDNTVLLSVTAALT
tara:strand:- start:713 stop:1921 length:1209 start_codon:yes stop_codon:yes gene_type:complete